MPEAPHTVLVVEDDDDLRDLLTSLLEHEGFEVASARNGLDALEYLRTHAPPCIIVLDLMMPVMSGPEFRAEQLRDGDLADIPVVVLSASHDGRRQAEAMRAHEFFPKPVPIDAFCHAVRARC